MDKGRDNFPDDKAYADGDSMRDPRYDLDDDMRLGDVMRGERATMGKSLLDVQRELRIRASYIAAIENADASAFDTPSFISGYVRSYSRYLGMDPEWAFRRFCKESGFQPVHGMSSSAAGPKPSRRPSDPAEALANPHALFVPQPENFWTSVEPRAIGSVLVLMLLVGGLGYGGWSVLQEVQRVDLTLDDEAPAVIAALDPTNGGMAGPDLNDGAETAVASDLPRPEVLDRIYRPQILEAPVLTARDGPISAIDPGFTQIPASADTMLAEAQAQAARNAAENSVIQIEPAFAVQPGGQVAEGESSVRTVAPDAPELELLAVRPAWVRVTSAEGTVLLEKIMDAGERYTLPKLEAAPLLRSGNSGAVYFSVNGQTYGPAAPGPQVIKNVELSSASLTEKYAVADPAADPELAEIIAVAQADTGDAGGE